MLHCSLKCYTLHILQRTCLNVLEKLQLDIKSTVIYYPLDKNSFKTSRKMFEDISKDS